MPDGFRPIVQPVEDHCDVVVVGAGIVGLAAARSLHQRRPGTSLLILEAEEYLGAHQTGHNSGVLHSGLPYRPGSEKALLCVEGARRMARFCEAEGLPLGRCGKIVVATDREEIALLDEVERRGRANGLGGLRRAGIEELAEREPHVSGIEGLIVPEAGIVDFVAVARRLARNLEADGHRVMLAQRVSRLRGVADGWEVSCSSGLQLHAKIIVNCAGLQSDRVARLAGQTPPVQIVPFRGDYYRLTPDAEHLVRHLIYPVPRPNLPFLGVHFTRRLDGDVEVGPSALLALGRHHYRGEPIGWRDVGRMLRFGGFWNLALRYWRLGLSELSRSLSKTLYVRTARRLVADLQSSDIEKADSGIRAQAVDGKGNLVDDFVMTAKEGLVNVLNAPSPAATAALAIGDRIADLAAELG
jgi:L-2-hydroxyglutarate oxidase